jgi:PTH1 family peptidyl-tRNA hydrolase
VRVLFGLGNPGRKYHNTRHNIGFMLLDYIAEKNQASFKAGKGDYYFADTVISGQSMRLVKPIAYMNNSGLALKQVLEGMQPDIPQWLAIYDDFHLPFGQLRFRERGSAGGHNGVKSLICELNSEFFDRLRIGIGAAGEDAIDHVLSIFSETEQSALPGILQKATEGVGVWIGNGLETAMNTYNRRIEYDESSEQENAGNGS